MTLSFAGWTKDYKSFETLSREVGASRRACSLIARQSRTLFVHFVTCPGRQAYVVEKAP